MRLNKHTWLTEVTLAADNANVVRIAVLFANKYRNEESGQLNPKSETLADVLGVSRQSINRAINWLVEAGFLAKTEARGGGALAYKLLLNGQEIPLQKSAVVRVFQNPTKAKSSNQTSKKLKGEHSHYKEEPSQEPKRARKTGPVADCPVRHVTKIQPGSPGEFAWNEWLAKQDEPNVEQLQAFQPDGSEALLMPFSMPPPPDDAVKNRITERFLDWVKAQMQRQRAESA